APASTTIRTEIALWHGLDIPLHFFGKDMNRDQAHFGGDAHAFGDGFFGRGKGESGRGPGAHLEARNRQNRAAHALDRFEAVSRRPVPGASQNLPGPGDDPPSEVA